MRRELWQGDVTGERLMNAHMGYSVEGQNIKFRFVFLSMHLCIVCNLLLSENNLHFNFS